MSAKEEIKVIGVSKPALDCPCPVATKVARNILRRAEAGFKKYGTNCARTDLDLAAWLQHLQEELLDAAVYVERLKQEVANLPRSASSSPHPLRPLENRTDSTSDLSSQQCR